MGSLKMETIGVKVRKCSETTVWMEWGSVAETWEVEERGRGSCFGAWENTHRAHYLHPVNT